MSPKYTNTWYSMYMINIYNSYVAVLKLICIRANFNYGFRVVFAQTLTTVLDLYSRKL